MALGLRVEGIGRTVGVGAEGAGGGGAWTLRIVIRACASCSERGAEEPIRVMRGKSSHGRGISVHDIGGD